jgi:hypothetical protein
LVICTVTSAWLPANSLLDLTVLDSAGSRRYSANSE